MDNIGQRQTSARVIIVAYGMNLATCCNSMVNRLSDCK